MELLNILADQNKSVIFQFLILFLKLNVGNFKIILKAKIEKSCLKTINCSIFVFPVFFPFLNYQPNQ